MSAAHLLIVEDSQVTLFKIKAMLVQMGYTVTAHSNPVEALNWLKKTNLAPDLIITDVVMPEMNGFDFIREVRSRRTTVKTPIIVLTTQGELEDKIAGLKAGADDYLLKTVTPSELDLRVQALLKRSTPSESAITQMAARAITLFSTKGGVGTTSLGVNLSVALSQLWGIDTCLWDLSFSGGHCAYMLNMVPQHTLIELNKTNEINDEIIAGFLLKHNSGVSLMPAPASTSEAELVTPAIVDPVWTFILGNFPYLVVDAGNHFTEPALAALERSDIILLTLAPEILSVKSAADVLQIFQKLKIDLNKIILVMNKIFPASQLPLLKIIPVLEQCKAVEIPYDSEAFVQAIFNGSPVITAAPKSKASLAIAHLAYELSSRTMTEKKKGYSSITLESIRKLVKM
jgi:pilus assembly protein CpaE